MAAGDMREGSGQRGRRALSQVELRAEIESLLNQLPASPGGRSLIPSFAGLIGTIIGQIGDRDHPLNWKDSDYADARKELLKLAEAIDHLSPTAKLGLTSGPMAHLRRLAAAFRLAADWVAGEASKAPVEVKVGIAEDRSSDHYMPTPMPPAAWLTAPRDLRSDHIDQTRSGQAKGRGPDVWARLVADNAADAYASITDKNPPVGDYYGKPVATVPSSNCSPSCSDLQSWGRAARTKRTMRQRD